MMINNTMMIHVSIKKTIPSMIPAIATTDKPEGGGVVVVGGVVVG